MSLYGIPLIIMLYCYSRIFCLLNAHPESNKNNVPMNNRTTNNNADERLLRQANIDSFNKMRHKTLRMSALFGIINLTID